MKALLLLPIDLVAVLARFLGPGGLRGLVAKNPLIEQQMLILGRSRQRPPNLSSLERFVPGLCTPFVAPGRIPEFTVGVRTSTLLELHQCLVRRKYRALVVMDQFTRRIIGFAVHASDVDGPALCRMFNQVNSRQPLCRYLGTDHDPFFRYQRWQANLRALEIEPTMTAAFVPLSHPFVEHLIGTVRSEFLDQTRSWNSLDLERKQSWFRGDYHGSRGHSSLGGKTANETSDDFERQRADVHTYRWETHCG